MPSKKPGDTETSPATSALRALGSGAESHKARQRDFVARDATSCGSGAELEAVWLELSLGFLYKVFQFFWVFYIRLQGFLGFGDFFKSSVKGFSFVWCFLRCFDEEPSSKLSIWLWLQASAK